MQLRRTVGLSPRLHIRLKGGVRCARGQRRQAMIEPVFAQTKSNRRMNRFRRRGRGAVRTERRLIHTTHNLLKLPKHQPAAAAA